MSSIEPYFTATPAAMFDDISILESLGDRGLKHLSLGTLDVVLRAMVPTKQRSVTNQIPYLHLPRFPRPSLVRYGSTATATY